MATTLGSHILTVLEGGGGIGAAYVRALAKAGYVNIMLAITTNTPEGLLHGHTDRI